MVTFSRTSASKSFYPFSFLPFLFPLLFAFPYSFSISFLSLYTFLFLSLAFLFPICSLSISPSFPSTRQSFSALCSFDPISHLIFFFLRKCSECSADVHRRSAELKPCGDRGIHCRYGDDHRGGRHTTTCKSRSKKRRARRRRREEASGSKLKQEREEEKRAKRREKQET